MEPTDAVEIESVFKAGLDPVMHILREEVALVRNMTASDGKYTTTAFGFRLSGLHKSDVDVKAWEDYAVEFVGRCVPGANVVYSSVTIETGIDGIELIYNAVDHEIVDAV